MNCPRGLPVVLCMVLMLLVAGCGDQPPEEAEAVEEQRRAVSPEEQRHRDAVVQSVTYASPELASQIRGYYRAMDAGDQSMAVKAVGGPAFVASELKAAEIFHYARPLDGCIERLFGTKKPEGVVRLVKKLAATRHGQALIDDAKRLDADGFAFDLSAFDGKPSKPQQVAAALETLSVYWRTLGTRKGSTEAVSVFANTMIHVAAVSDGKCVPDPKLHSLLDPKP